MKKVKKSIFIDETHRIFLDEFAAKKLHEKNDLKYLTPSGIIEVDTMRWKEAQTYNDLDGQGWS